MKLTFLWIALLFPALVIAQGPPPAMVEVQPVRQDALAISRPLVASVEAVMRSQVAAEIAGRVRDRSFDEGQRVEKGQALATLDTDLLQADQRSAQAAVKSAEAQLVRARASLSSAQREVDRQQDLFNRRVSPEKELLDAKTALEVAQAEITVAEAAVAQRQAELARFDVELAKANVVAPFSGVVARRNVEVGQWLDQGAMVAEIVQLDPLFITVNVPESLVGELSAESKATVRFDALPDESLSAQLEQLLPQADEESRTVRVRFKLENDDLKIRPGFFARVTLLSTTQSGLIVPRDAILRSGPATMVMAFKDGAAAPIPVTIVGGVGDELAVTGPLNAGDLVVTRGNETVFPGQPLIPMNLGPPPGGPPEQK